MRHAALVVVLLLFVGVARGQDRSWARSMVISQQGIVATSQTLASQAGAEILARGGSAADAAIAANAVLGVVEASYNGIGGDLFAIEWDAHTGRLAGLNASGWAPTGLTIDMLKAKGYTRMPQQGIYSVTVPGAVDGWTQLHARFGKLPWSELFAPAIYYADNGFPVTELIDANWKDNATKLRRDANATAVYLPGGNPPAVGQVFRNPRLAAALRLLAAQGEKAFYQGPIGAAILKTSARLGGTMTAADLADFHAQWVQPLSTVYNGWTVYELPPNTQGIAALEMLNIMAQFPLRQEAPDGVQALHTEMEAQKLAYADMRRYDADPRVSPVPVAGIISLDYARRRAALISPDKANCASVPGVPPGADGPGDTIYLSVIDRDGNIVSLIQSLYQSFGSGVVVDDFGFALQNRGALFTLDSTHPNALAPHKRPFHTLIPAFMEKGDLHIGFGIMGGYNQAQAHAQFVSDIVDHDMNIQAALEAPRFTKQDFGGCDVQIEARVPPDVRAALTAEGHVLRLMGDYSSEMGGGQAVMRDSAAGVNYGASSPRKDGAAIPEPAPYWKK